MRTFIHRRKLCLGSACMISALLCGCKTGPKADQNVDRGRAGVVDASGGGGRKFCPPYFFDLMHYLVGPDNWLESEGTDISGDGKYVVGDSAADEAYTATDGAASNHPFEATGWTRECEGKPFLQIPMVNPPGLKNGGAGLVGLGYIPASMSASFAKGISPDGKVIVGWSYVDPLINGLAPTEGVVFDHQKHIFRLGKLNGDVLSMANDASERFTGSRRPEPLLPPGRERHLAARLVHERIIVGYSSTANQHAHRTPGAKAVFWGPFYGQLNELTVPASTSYPTKSAEAVCISDKGLVAAGNLYYGEAFDDSGAMPCRPCVWMWDNTAKSFGPALVLDDLQGGRLNARVRHISGNGLVIVGSGNGPNGERACMWVRQLGGTSWSAPVDLGLLPGSATYSVANGTDYFGKYIVGVSGSPPDAQGKFSQKATLWEINGMSASSPKDIVSIFHANNTGMNIDDNWATQAMRISQFGKRITGDCWHPDVDGIHEGWVGAIP